MKRISLVLFGLLLIIVSVGAQIKVACVGNSITYGAGIEGRDSLAYPQQMAKILGAEWEVKNFGVSGATMLKVSNRPYWVMPEYYMTMEFEPDVVIIKLGTNDSKPYNWDGHRKDFEDNYLEMIENFRKLPSSPIIYVCIPVPAFGIRWDIRPYIIDNEVIPSVRKIAEVSGAPIIDLYPCLKEKRSFVPIRFIPMPEGARIMAEKISTILIMDKTKITSRKN